MHSALTPAKPAPVSSDVMTFSKEFIQNLSQRNFSEQDKRHLIRKFFPPPGDAPWQEHLRKGWEGNKRWHRLLGDRGTTKGEAELYRVSPEEILQRAKITQPQSIGNTVSHFTEWIYSLYIQGRIGKSLEKGKELERQLAARTPPKPSSDNWKLIYTGCGETASSAKKISSLTVDGSPIWGKPDLVFRENDTGRILIVELKWSRSVIPRDGWPNVRAQLWCYSRIDDFQGAPEVLLASEVWQSGLYGPSPVGAWCWKAGLEPWESYHKELFSHYGGQSH